MPSLPTRHGSSLPPQPPLSRHPHVTAARAYAKDVCAGRIPACKWVRLACERWQRDLAREQDPTWPYRFDPAKAERVCRFIECLPHTKGKWAAKREPLVLRPWQAWLLCCLFGFLRKRDGFRRFRIFLWLIPRKNGKSQLGAGIGLYMLAADGEHGAEVYCGATTERQAWEVFRPARLMALGTPALTGHYGIEVNASNLHILSNGSRFEPLIGKPGDGASPSLALLDEYHEHDTAEQRDTMLTGMGAREQPLLGEITTAGDNLAGPCYDDVLTGRKVLEGVIEDEERFYVEWGIDDEDDWASAEALHKANPNLGISISEEFLLQRQHEAVRNAREQGRFKVKHLNLWVNARSAYFNMRSWAQCRADVRLEDFEGERCIVGMDLASKQDVAAVQILIPLNDGRYATFGRYYLPEDVVQEPGRDHYRAWALAAPPQLILTPGNMIDFERIEEDLHALRERFTVDEVAFDPAQATMLVTRLMGRGVAVSQFDQTARNFSEPMKQVAALMDAGKLIHDCEGTHPMTWMVSNVVSRTDAKEQVYPRKEKPESKIDGPVALIMAMARAMIGGAPPPSVYEQRGLLTF